MTLEILLEAIRELPTASQSAPVWIRTDIDDLEIDRVEYIGGRVVLVVLEDDADTKP